MNKKTILLALFCLLSMSIFAQDIVTEQRSVDPFSGISSCCDIEVYLSDGSSSTVTVKANADVIGRVVTIVKGGILNIKVEKTGKNKKTKEKIEVYVSAKELKSLKASSSSKIKGQNAIRVKNIDLSASSGSSITLDLNANNLKCEASSDGRIYLEGSSSNAKVSGSSGARVDMRSMTVTNAKVDVSSGANIKIAVKNEIKANASSGGSIDYYGNPTKVSMSKNSGGSINQNKY